MRVYKQNINVPNYILNAQVTSRKWFGKAAHNWAWLRQSLAMEQPTSWPIIRHKEILGANLQPTCYLIPVKPTLKVQTFASSLPLLPRKVVKHITLQACVSTLGTVKTEKIPGTLILLSKEPTSDDQKKIAICVSNLGSSGNTGVVSSDDKNKLMLNCLTNENLSASITPEGKLDVPGNQTDSERKINKCLPVILGPNVVTVEVNKVLTDAEQNSVIACFKKPGKSVNYGFRVFDNKKTFVSIASPEGSTFVEKLKKDCVV